MSSNSQAATSFYVKNKKRGLESVSGYGSFLNATEAIRKHLPIIFEKFNIKSIIDCPCGDWNWMKYVDLSGIDYLGLDIVSDIVQNNHISYSNDRTKFAEFDILDGALMPVDLFICRDLLFHLSLENQSIAIQNIIRSEPKYLLTTSSPWVTSNEELAPRELAANWGWRHINMELPPFNMSKPIYSFNEGPLCENRFQNLYSIGKYSSPPKKQMQSRFR